MNKPKNDFATFRAILDEAIESGQTTRKAIGMAAEADDDMVRRWLSGQMPKLKNLRALLASDLLPIALLDAIADWLVRRSPYRMVRTAELDLTTIDHDCNGIVDKHDTAAHVIAAAAKAIDALDQLNGPVVAGECNEAKKAQLSATLYDLKAKLEKGLLTIEQPTMRLAK
jgi:hypothetical protein